LRHGTDGFTSLPKEGVLRIFSPEKSDGFGLGTRGQHANHQTTEAAFNGVTFIPSFVTIDLLLQKLKLEDTDTYRQQVISKVYVGSL
jgi:hypothetical protein